MSVDALAHDLSTPRLTLFSLALQTPANTCRARRLHVTARYPIGSCGVVNQSIQAKHTRSSLYASKAEATGEKTRETTLGESPSRDIGDPSFHTPCTPVANPPLIRGGVLVLSDLSLEGRRLSFLPLIFILSISLAGIVDGSNS